ncbi:hypothetical protein BN1708_001292 [Verticillium longisporum]|uniref:PhoD-like phosphatase metallophosphatase domain-containing protein n=1 Tax=Verticillium longisporum TaxID=100787 RepID=A0A0G4MNK5_VERLO|nr:hypothetical protein BN1708_001292 [Verticillium longisporum]
MSLHEKTARYSSTVLRLLSYSFFRWVAGPAAVPLTILTLFAVYVPSFIISYLKGPDYQVVDDQVEVIVEEPVVVEGEAGQDDKVVLEAEIDETITLEEKPASPLKSFLTGAPIHHSPILSLLTFLINVALATMVSDVLFRARYQYPSNDLSFVRLGYVSHNEAKFLVREPDQTKLPVTLEIHVKDAVAPFDNPLWLTGGEVTLLDNSTDFTTVLDVPLRHPQQRIYEWRTSNNHSGEFTSPPKPGQLSSYNDGKFTFLSTSCILPRFPYNPLDHPLSIPGLRHLAKLLPSLQAQLMLFLGDFIYIDPNPPAALVAGSSRARRLGATYYEFTQGPASFFLLDTRTYRSDNYEPFESENKTMLGAQQLEDFLAWLNRPEPKGVQWKIVASSVPLTKNWPVNTKDTWGGFLSERRKVLEAMWDAGARGVGVVIVSGDRHEFAATKFPPPEGGRWPEMAAPHEFSCSPLNQFSSPVPTYRQYDDEDVAIKYIHSGNAKFGALTIESHEGGTRSSLTYRLFIDGNEVWDTVVLTPTVPKVEKTPASFWNRIMGGA